MNCYKCATPVPDNARFCSACGTDVSGDSHSHVRDTPSVEQDRELFNKLQAELGTEYILERELGRGGMAVVYLGHDSRLNRKIAVKLLPPELTYASTSMVERFKREAQTAARLDHPNIIPVYRVAPGGKLFWYVMKYLDGQPLNDILEAEGQLDVERTVDIVSQAAAALDYAHQNKVVHRDVKPANVVVDKKVGQPFVRVSGLDEGIYYWVVSAIDAKGGESQPSMANRFNLVQQVNAGQQAFLEIARITQHGRVVEVVGRTEPGSTVIVNNEQVFSIAADGKFTHFTSPLTKTGANQITITAQNRKGDINTIRKSVVLE